MAIKIFSHLTEIKLILIIIIIIIINYIFTALFHDKAFSIMENLFLNVLIGHKYVPELFIYAECRFETKKKYDLWKR